MQATKLDYWILIISLSLKCCLISSLVSVPLTGVEGFVLPFGRTLFFPFQLLLFNVQLTAAGSSSFLALSFHEVSPVRWHVPIVGALTWGA